MIGYIPAHHALPAHAAPHGLTHPHDTYAARRPNESTQIPARGCGGFITSEHVTHPSPPSDEPSKFGPSAPASRSPDALDEEVADVGAPPEPPVLESGMIMIEPQPSVRTATSGRTVRMNNFQVMTIKLSAMTALQVIEVAASPTTAKDSVRLGLS